MICTLLRRQVEALGHLDGAARQRVHFAQIQGMADPLTAGLAAAGFSSLKLLVRAERCGRGGGCRGMVLEALWCASQQDNQIEPSEHDPKSHETQFTLLEAPQHATHGIYNFWKTLTQEAFIPNALLHSRSSWKPFPILSSSSPAPPPSQVFGDFASVAPWLVRRLVENQDLLGAAGPELALLRAELAHRLRGA